MRPPWWRPLARLRYDVRQELRAEYEERDNARLRRWLALYAREMTAELRLQAMRAGTEELYRMQRRLEHLAKP